MFRDRRTAAMALSTAVLVLSGACAGDDGPSTSPSPSPAPDATRSFTVDEADVSFELPSDWEEFDREKMLEALSDSEAMEDLTDRMGITTDQFRQLMSSDLVLYVTAPEAQDEFLGNVNVIVTDEAPPTAGQLELQYRGLGATDIETDEVATEVGEALTIRYTLDLQGTEAHGESILAEVDDQLVMVTISTGDADETADLADDLRDSLARAS